TNIYKNDRDGRPWLVQHADRSTRIWVTVAALFEYFSIANTRFCVDELLLRGKNRQHDNHGFNAMIGNASRN
ncbi:MAG: hypothetical protein GY820_27865, partial [Gammaproteobacteria bacterium]|nr:hypothetical protein [Gammaproteobacteria bacterium]